MFFKKKEKSNSDISNSKPEDIEKFCDEVLKWKVQANKKDEIFDLFRDKPQYLFGFLSYKMIQIEEENKKIQSLMYITAVTTVVLAFIAIGMTFYQSISKPEFPFIAILFILAAVWLYYIGYRISKMQGK